MTDLIWVISSSVMIIAVMILRAVFGKRIKSGVRMILWGLVLLRLLIPGTFLESPTSFASVASKIETVDTFDALKNIERVDYHEPFKAIEFYPENSSEESFFRDGVSSKKFERVDKTLGVKKVLTYVWYAGAAATALIFLVTNLSLFVRLKRRRRMIEADCPLRVYVVENIDSPFLFGRSIYVDKATSEDGELLRYVLAHEMSHHRHVDQLTSILRFAAVSIHWYNPLVWVAAELSRRDADLFADDEAIRSLGDGERENYGKVLIGLSSVAKRPTILNGATMMTGGKSALFFRIKRIAKNTKTSFAVILITLSLTALGLAFIGRAEDGLIADKEHETIKIGIKDDGHLDLPDKDLIDSIDILYLDGCLGSTDGVDGGTEAADEIYSALDNITVDTSSVTTHKRQLIEGGYGLTVKIFLKDRTTYTVSFSYDKFPGPSTEEYYSEYKTTGYERLKNAVNKLKNIIITPDQTEPEFRFTVVGRNGYEVKFSVIDNNMNLLYSTSAESGAVDFTLDTDQKELLYSYINDIKSVSKNAEYERPDFKAFTNSRLYTEVTYEFGEYSFTTFYELTDNAAVKESMRFFSDFLPESAFRHSDNDSGCLTVKSILRLWGLKQPFTLLKNMQDGVPERMLQKTVTVNRLYAALAVGLMIFGLLRAVMPMRTAKILPLTLTATGLLSLCVTELRAEIHIQTFACLRMIMV